MVSNTHEDGQIVMIICDACGDQGYEDLLVICSKCKIGAEHTYCMMVKPDVPEEWICHGCTEDKDGAGEGEETSSIMEERTLSQPELLSAGLNIDLNVDPNIDMNAEPSSRKRKIGPTDDLELTEEAASQADLLNTKNPRPWLDLNKEPNPDFDEDPNIGLM